MNALTPYEPKSKPVLTSSEDRLFDSLHELKDLLLRRRRVLVASMGGCLLLASAYLVVTPPKYTASATLMIDGQQHTEVVHQDPVAEDAQVLNAMVESEVEILHSPGLARDVVRRLDLMSDPSFKARIPASSGTDDSSDQAQERAAQQLLRMMSAKRVGMTYVIEIDVTAGTAKEAARLANGVTATYLAMQVRTQGDTTRQAADWLNQQMEALRVRALSADEAVQSFKAAHGIIETDQGSLEKEQVTTLNTQLLAATARTAQAQARVDRLSKVAGGNVVGAEGMLDVVQDPVLTVLQQHYFEVTQREEEIAKRYGASHAIVLKLKGQMADLQGSIHQEVERIAAAARSDLVIAQTGEATIRAQLADLIGQSGTSGSARAKLRSLESEAAIYRAVYANSLQHYAQSMQDQSFPVVAAHVVSPAEPPLAKSKPRRTLVVAGALVLGVAAGVCLALVMEFLDQTLTSVGQLERELGVPCLARLPRLTWRGGAKREELALLTAMSDLPDSQFAREIRRLRLRLLQHLGETRSGVIGVMASRRGDGASTVAHNLSSALMAGGRSVALLSLQSAAPANPAVLRAGGGLSNALTVVDVRSSRCGDLLRRLNDLREMHDIVVVDMPPLFDLDEADDIIRSLECVVLVAQTGTTSSRHLLDLVDGSGIEWARVAGVVMNCADRETVEEVAL